MFVSYIKPIGSTLKLLSNQRFVQTYAKVVFFHQHFGACFVNYGKDCTSMHLYIDSSKGSSIKT